MAVKVLKSASPWRTCSKLSNKMTYQTRRVRLAKPFGSVRNLIEANSQPLKLFHLGFNHGELTGGQPAGCIPRFSK